MVRTKIAQITNWDGAPQNPDIKLISLKSLTWCLDASFLHHKCRRGLKTSMYKNIQVAVTKIRRPLTNKFLVIYYIQLFVFICLSLYNRLFILANMAAVFFIWVCFIVKWQDWFIESASKRNRWHLLYHCQYSFCIKKQKTKNNDEYIFCDEKKIVKNCVSKVMKPEMWLRFSLLNYIHERAVIFRSTDQLSIKSPWEFKSWHHAPHD